MRCARLEMGKVPHAPYSIFSDREPIMTRKPRNLSFDQVLEILRIHSFDVAPSTGAAGGMLVSKHGVAAVLAPSKEKGAPAVFVVQPGTLIKGEVAALLDRGYQKFLLTSHFELPASASQLHAIHLFTEEFKLLSGGISLYNQSLGTTSDVYQYDRLKGREEVQPEPPQPWEPAGGH